MKIMSYSIIHYGISYLNYALRSIAPVVDQSLILYTPHPSHGHVSDSPPIESRDELIASIPADEWNKLTWIDTDQFWHEGQQRDYAVRKCESFDAALLLVLDYDEIWPEEVLARTLHYVARANSARNWLLNFYGHFWRSFGWICRDDAWPVRIIDLRHRGGTAYLPRELGPVYHFGYAVTDRVMRYKMSLHGHKSEWRPEWYEEKWLAWPPQENCHPTNGRKGNGEGWWNPEPFDRAGLPKILHSHPYFAMEKVE